MIIYQMKKPIECIGTDCVGVTGDNIAYTQDFYIKGVSDESITYTIHLRFADGSVNSVSPSTVRTDGEGTGISWVVKKNDIFTHGYFEVQIEGRNSTGLVFQTEIVKLYADESLPIEDKEYENPNSETLHLREEAYNALEEIKAQQKQIEQNLDLIEQSDLSVKADKATTLSGYGITDAYTKAETDSVLSLKISNESGSVSTNNIADKAVTTAKLANGSVTSIKIANNAVSGATIAQNQISTGHIINGAVTSDKLSDDVKTLINEKAKSDDVNLKLSEKADKSTTLSGYGITDAYTKEQSKNIFGLTISVVFDENFIPLNYTENSQISAGSFATGNKKIKTAYIAKNLRYIGGGAFANCDNLTDVYIDNPPEGITIASGSIPSTATIHYNSDFNDNKNLIAALTNLNSQVSAKYDSSNIEEGSGTLTVYTPAAVESNLVKSCTFRYQKTGNTANIFFSVVFNEGSISYLQFTGLPFIAKNESDQNRHIAATNKQNQVIVYPVGSWLTLNFNGTKTFSQDEILNGVITILIN